MYWMLEMRAPKGQEMAMIGKQPDLSAVSGTPVSWMFGARFNFKMPIPLDFSLDPEGGDFIPEFFEPEIPLMSKRLREALQSGGVDNLDIYDAIIADPKKGQSRNDYAAVNILGAISCANLDKSDCDVFDPSDPVDVMFRSLVIDEQRAGGALLFRLAEALHGVVVHENVKAAVERANLPGVVFVRPEDWVS